MKLNKKIENKSDSKNFKKAISLIVLVITIIVLAILAAAVIISISNTNIMQKALAATFEADMQELKSKYTIWLAGYIAENEEYDINEINYATGDSYLLNTILGGQVPDKYKAGLKVVKGKLVYGEEDSGSGSGPATNPHEGEEWVEAYWYNEADGWSDKLTTGDAIPANATITAKFYANGETVTPNDLDYSGLGFNITFTEGDAYDLVIEGTGDMGEFYSYDSDNAKWIDKAWVSERSDYIDDTTLSTPIMFYVTNVIISDEITNIVDETLTEYTSLTSITIGNGVTSIGEFAFAGCTSLTTITIPNSVTSIGSCAFERCKSLTTINIPSSVTSIGDGTFYRCTSLTTINIPNSVTSIDENAFWGCTNLKSVTMPISLIENFENLFDDIPLISLTLFGDGQAIPQLAFGECTNLKEIIISDGVTSIGKTAFWGCTNLISVTIPNSVTTIGDGAFASCTSLSSITIPSSVTNIPLEIFFGCTNLATVNIPSSVTTISPGAFAYCTSLETVTIPSSVTSIGEQAFYDVPHIYYDGIAEGSPWGAVAIN